MLSIAIFSDQSNDIGALKIIIQDYLIEHKMIAKISFFEKPDELLLAPYSYDAYLLDLDSKASIITIGKQLKELDKTRKFIYTSHNPNLAHLAAKVRSDYFITKPFDKEEVVEILDEIKNYVKQESIIIKIPNGERRIRINNLNYINIVRRCLCYHLKDGAMFDGQALRSSFEKAIDPLDKHKSFLFLPPSLLINLSEIKIVNADNLIFENNDVLYFPKKSCETVRSAWKNYNRID